METEQAVTVEQLQVRVAALERLVLALIGFSEGGLAQVPANEVAHRCAKACEAEGKNGQAQWLRSHAAMLDAMLDPD